MKALNSSAVMLASALILLMSVSAWSEMCEPVFKVITYNRSLPSSYVDQGLSSLPHLYPKHVLLAQRRSSEIGDVAYSLLVYKKDAAKPEVTIEGVAVRQSKAWTFTASCSSEDRAMEGLVTTLERIAALSKGKE